MLAMCTWGGGGSPNRFNVAYYAHLIVYSILVLIRPPYILAEGVPRLKMWPSGEGRS